MTTLSQTKWYRVGYKEATAGKPLIPPAHGDKRKTPMAYGIAVMDHHDQYLAGYAAALKNWGRKYKTAKRS